MRRIECDTPVLVLGCGLGGLAIFRSLGQLGVSVYGVDDDRNAPAAKSRYCRKFFRHSFNESLSGDFLLSLLTLGKEFPTKPLLIPTTDELAVFVSEHANALEASFVFPRNIPGLVRSLSSKRAMYDLARHHGLKTPLTLFPQSLREVDACMTKLFFPVLVKGVWGNRLQSEAGFKMKLISSSTELYDCYQRLSLAAASNIMLQEYIPGGDDQIYIFNGYFNETAECLAAFTGFKIRQSPIHFGSASLGECRWRAEVAEMTTTFLKKVGYRGVVDIGYRFDRRDGTFKVLDINPRVGQAFRLFVAENGLDVVRSLYLDLSGQKVPECVPREGRRWLIENNDIISSWHYFKEGSLEFSPWLKSFRGVQETAWFRLKDPVPFLVMMWRFFKRIGRWTAQKIRFH